MKRPLLTLCILLTAALGSQTLYAAGCNLTLKKKSVTSKSAYLNGTSISAKVQAALGSACTVEYRMMSTKDLIQFEQLRFNKKIEKLKAQANMR